MAESLPTWTPDSWRSKRIAQQPEYDDPQALNNALDKVKSLPPLIHQNEILALKKQLAEVSQGKRFLLQGGDCAERFLDCNKTAIENKFKILLQMSLIIIWKTRIPIVRIARMAGQFAKPRSSPNEVINGVSLPSFKGDNVNSFDISGRTPDPQRLVQAYFHSAATLNYLRAMVAGGVADLHDVEKWSFANIRDSDVRKEYTDVVNQITSCFKFFQLFDADSSDMLKKVDIFTSHEGLLLNYEESLTEKIGDKYYNTGAHFLWIGDRTRQLDGAHIEYFRGIENPIGVKVGPSMKPEELAELIKVLNPNKEHGKLTLITRYGCNNISTHLSGHIKAVQQTDIPVLWCCDPCHGNTETTQSGLKTRNFENIMLEIILCFKIHQECQSKLGGIHMELTGDDVTECIGGASGLEPAELSRNYETFCDPRLNYTQSLDIAFSIAREMGKFWKKKSQ